MSRDALSLFDHVCIRPGELPEFPVDFGVSVTAMTIPERHARPEKHTVGCSFIVPSYEICHEADSGPEALEALKKEVEEDAWRLLCAAGDCNAVPVGFTEDEVKSMIRLEFAERFALSDKDTVDFLVDGYEVIGVRRGTMLVHVARETLSIMCLSEQRYTCWADMGLAVLDVSYVCRGFVARPQANAA